MINHEHCQFIYDKWFPDPEVTKQCPHYKILKKNKIAHNVIYFANQDIEYSIKREKTCTCILWNYVHQRRVQNLYVIFRTYLHRWHAANSLRKHMLIFLLFSYLKTFHTMYQRYKICYEFWLGFFFPLSVFTCTSVSYKIYYYTSRIKINVCDHLFLLLAPDRDIWQKLYLKTKLLLLLKGCSTLLTMTVFLFIQSFCLSCKLMHQN